jgi:hypothetical protein
MQYPNIVVMEDVLGNYCREVLPSSRQHWPRHLTQAPTDLLSALIFALYRARGEALNEPFKRQARQIRLPLENTAACPASIFIFPGSCHVRKLTGSQRRRCASEYFSTPPNLWSQAWHLTSRRGPYSACRGYQRPDSIEMLCWSIRWKRGWWSLYAFLSNRLCGCTRRLSACIAMEQSRIHFPLQNFRCLTR